MQNQMVFGDRLNLPAIDIDSEHFMLPDLRVKIVESAMAGGGFEARTPDGRPAYIGGVKTVMRIK